jgi:FkbM family methyltransferase
LYWGGLHAWEPDTVDVFYRLAQRAAAVADIGANTGMFALLACAANPAARVAAFEPVPAVYERLVCNLRANNWESRCMARREAVSDRAGTTQFHVPNAELPKSASLNPQGFRGYSGTLIDVAVTTADEALRGMPVELAKIDVEGFEDKVLLGMQGVLRDQAPTIVMECNPDGPFRECEATLRAHDYCFMLLHGGAPRPSDHIVPDASEAHRNVLCVSRRRLAEVQNTLQTM